ncbi:MAG: DUF3267 domain-containing protein [Paludibacteraceae bacterium]|nr:DUF3267 domain-containing protein [Paludibacteraceae bacterium]
MTVNELKSNPDYKLLDEVKHDEMKNFIVAEVEQQPPFARIANMYQIAGLLAFVIGGFRAFMPFFTNRETIYLWWLLAGLVFTFTVLIALHELIHAVAYRFVGAKNLSFGMSLRKFMFYVQADGQVLNFKQFQIVALAPAVLVSALSLVGMAVFYTHPAFYFFIPVFGLHSIFCGGDFGLLCYFQNRKDKEILTFDVKAESKTCFFECCNTQPIADK